jgi:hypothetical protein
MKMIKIKNVAIIILNYDNLLPPLLIFLNQGKDYARRPGKKDTTTSEIHGISQ